MTVIIESPHLREITQILVLTDFYNRLSFVTLSLDGWIKIWDEEGNQEREGVQASGQLLNGSVVPSRNDLYIVSIQNEETEENQVCIYRRLTLKRPLQLDTSLQVLDLKVSNVGNVLYVPTAHNFLERIELKDL